MDRIRAEIFKNLKTYLKLKLSVLYLFTVPKREFHSRYPLKVIVTSLTYLELTTKKKGNLKLVSLLP